MADFCNKCSHYLFGDVEPEIDINKKAEELQPERITYFLCESCEAIGLLKNKKGKNFIMFSDKEGMSIEEYNKFGSYSYSKRKLRREKMVSIDEIIH